MSNEQSNVTANNEYKDRLFNFIFGSPENRKWTLSLYNAVNGSAYTDENVFHNSKEILLYTDNELIKYKVIAVKIIDGRNNEHMKLIFYNDADFLQHMNRLLSGSLYVGDNATFSSSDRVLILQVCHYDPMGSYLLVICKEKK